MRLRAVAVFVAFLLFLGCAKEKPLPPPTPPKAAGPLDGGQVARRLDADVNTLSYLLQSTEDERQVLAYIYDPLIDFDQNLNPIPGLAQRWEVADGGLTYVLHLDPRATFSDGKPVLASDVVFTLRKVLDEESMQFGSWFDALDRQKTKAIDERTVRVVFKEPRVTQLLSFNISVIPEHVYGAGDYKKNTKVIGSGPYVLVRRETGRSILVQRRKDYWRARPHIESVLFRVISDDTVAWNALKRGDVDVARITNDTWVRGKDEPAVRGKIDFQSLYLLGYNCIVWNLDDPLFNDVRVRRALAMSFDLPTVIDKLYQGQARPITGPFTPDQWANDPRVQPIAFNLQGAAALLSAAGWTDSNNDGVLDRDGKKFAFKALIPAGNAPATNESQVLQDALKQIGVVMEITPLDDSAYFEQLLSRNFQAVFAGWVNEPDPDPYALFHSSQVPPAGLNVVGYKNPEADQLIEQGRIEFDRARRTEIYHRLHEILARDQPYLWTVQPATKWGVNRRVENVKASTGGLGLFLWNPGPHGWWLKKPS